MAVEPTVPKLIVLPLTVPVRVSVPDVDRLIVPASFPDDSTHVRLNVPVYAPLYVPVHLPLSAPGVAAAGDEELGVEAGVVDAALGADAAGVDELDGPDELLHPHASAAGSSTATAATRGRLTRARH